MIEADKGVVDERRIVGDAVQIQCESTGRSIKGQVDLVREYGRRLGRLQPVGIRDRERDAVSCEAAEIMPSGRDGERTARHPGDGRAGMHVPFVKEIDIPGVRTGRQCAVFRICCICTEGDDIACSEDSTIRWREIGYDWPVAGADEERG